MLAVLYIDNKLGNYLAKIDKSAFNKASEKVKELYNPNDPSDPEFNEMAINRMFGFVLKTPRSQWSALHYCFVAFRVTWWAIFLSFIIMYFSGVVHVN